MPNNVIPSHLEYPFGRVKKLVSGRVDMWTPKLTNQNYDTLPVTDGWRPHVCHFPIAKNYCIAQPWKPSPAEGPWLLLSSHWGPFLGSCTKRLRWIRFKKRIGSTTPNIIRKQKKHNKVWPSNGICDMFIVKMNLSSIKLSRKMEEKTNAFWIYNYKLSISTKSHQEKSEGATTSSANWCFSYKTARHWVALFGKNG